MVGKVSAVIILSVLLKCIDSGIVPANPCPDVFQYFQDYGIIYGKMEFQNDYSRFYQLTVNMSVPAYRQTTENIRLELRTPTIDLAQGRPLIYHVYFPVQDIIPKPTRIELNQKVYCISLPEEVKPGLVVTNMWATTYFRITSSTSPLDSDVQIQYLTAPDVTPPPQSFNFPVLSPVTTSAPLPVITYAPLTDPTNFPDNPPFLSDAGVSSIDQRAAGEQCGSSTIQSQVAANSNNVTDGQFPWLVAILYKRNFSYTYRCTGSLVSNRHVITAGHCIRYNRALLSPFKDLIVVLGKRNIENWASDALLRDVKSIVVHPEYRQNSGDGDIAVITVTKPITFEENIMPACLWQEDEMLDKVVGTEGMVIGWGRDDTGNGVIFEATKVNLPIVSQAVCRRSHLGFSAITSSRTFCAGERNGEGPCHGGTGAGLVINKNGKWTLRGVVANGLGDLGTCDLRNYIVFADVAKFKSWINDVMA